MALITGDAQYQQGHAVDTAVTRLIVVFVICFVISYVSVALRIISRRIRKLPLGLDDWLILLSLLFSTAFLSLNIASIYLGLGRHEILVTNVKGFVLGYTFLEILYTVTIFVVKSSTLCLWHRLFLGKRFTGALWLIGAVVAAYSITQLVCVAVQCLPLRSLWDPSVKGTCIDLNTVFLICSSFNVVTDVCILVLPITQLWRLQMSVKQKLQLVAMFSLGGFVVVISIIRLPQLREISQSDQSWTLTNSAIWTSLECAVATCCACLPTLRPLFSLLSGRGSEMMSSPRKQCKSSFTARVVRSWRVDERIYGAHPAQENKREKVTPSAQCEEAITLSASQSSLPEGPGNFLPSGRSDKPQETVQSHRPR